jgi:hypothetical protein
VNDSATPLLDDKLDILWPQKGDALVTPSGDGFFLVQTRSDEQWETYVAAYRMAAERLVEQTRDGTMSINWLVFPIVFLYRHFLELRLKSLIWDADALDKKPVRRLDKTHSLVELWAICRLAIEKWSDNPPTSDLDAVGDTLTQFQDMDPRSQAARYTKDTAGKPSGLLGRQLNLKTFAETVTKTGNFLDAVSDEFSRVSNALSELSDGS